LKHLAAVALAFIVAGCAAPPPPKPTVAGELFAVIPGSGGHVGTIVVERGGERKVINTAYGAERITPEGTLVEAKLSQEEVQRNFSATLESLPGRPTSFILYFLEGRDELTAESKAELQKVFVELKKRPLPDIVVIGHTDTVGSLSFNDKLSLARAERLREMLAGLGIDRERISAAGRGKRELLVPTDDNMAEPRNRRVEINVR